MSPRFSLLASAAAFCLAAVAIGVSFRAVSKAWAIGSASPAARDYVRMVEAKVAVTEIAWGIALCAERSGKLPPTASKVPADPLRVRGRFYQSELSDWDAEAFKCADFHLARPQRFQYEWSVIVPDTEGVVVAVADYDRDGAVDQQVRLPLRCSAQEARLRCRPDPMPTAPSPLGAD